MARVLVTGAAGFIGAATSLRLLHDGHEVTGLDCFTPYYDVKLKHDRLARITGHPSFTFLDVNLADPAACRAAFERGAFDFVVHLAAQPGVRYSLQNPSAYVEANVTAFLNVLEGCRHHPVRHLLYASSSSVYGGNSKVPFSVRDNVDRPVSLYAATKKANELMAHTYSHLFGIPSTGLRFFTVYGPWGRPDMAPIIFTKAILEHTPLKVFNFGDMKRDFTYIEDIVEGVIRVLSQPPIGPGTRHTVYNIGSSAPVDLMAFIGALESLLGRKAVLEMLPMQPGDVPATFADVSELERDIGFRPGTSLEYGLRTLVEWYLSYYRPPYSL